VTAAVGATSCGDDEKFLMYYFGSGLSGPLYIWFDTSVFGSADRMALVRVFGIGG